MDLSVETPSFAVPSTVLITHSSRIADSWTPMPEIVLLPSRVVHASQLTISVTPGHSRDLGTAPRVRHPRKILKRLKTIRLGDRLIFDARYETDRNIAHQVELTNIALLARRELSAALGTEAEVTVILRDQATGYAQALYRQLGIPVVMTDSHVEGRFVRFRDLPVRVTQGGKLLFEGGAPASVALIPQILPSAHLPAPPGDLPEKIFVSRRGARSITNDAEVTDLLGRRGFAKFYFEDEPYERQLALCKHARAIVAIHGAAMSYMAYNGNGLARPAGDLSGLRVVELFGSGYSAEMYRRYAGALNAHWCGVRGQITPEVVRDLDLRNLPRSHQASPFHIDPAALEMALDYSERAAAGPAPADLWG